MVADLAVELYVAGHPAELMQSPDAQERFAEMMTKLIEESIPVIKEGLRVGWLAPGRFLSMWGFWGGSFADFGLPEQWIRKWLLYWIVGRSCSWYDGLECSSEILSGLFKVQECL